MDPDANLTELRERVDDLQEYLERQPVTHLTADRRDDVERVLDLFAGLDQWLSGGGFLPTAWRRPGG